MPDAKGLRDIATLLARPREPVHAAQLAGLVAPAGADPVLDDQARAAYKARLTELDEDIDDATAGNDLERAARAAAERDALISELTRALGLGGRSRRLGDDSERARKAVTARIHHAIDHLAALPPRPGRPPPRGHPHRNSLHLSARRARRPGTSNYPAGGA